MLPSLPPGISPAKVSLPMQRDDTTVTPIANAPEISTPVDSAIPNDYEFEIFRLRRRVAELESIVLDKTDRLSQAVGMIEDELLFWRTGTLEHVWETMSGIMRRIARLEGTLLSLKDIQPHVTQKLEPPANWRNKMKQFLLPALLFLSACGVPPPGYSGPWLWNAPRPGQADIYSWLHLPQNMQVNYVYQVALAAQQTGTRCDSSGVTVGAVHSELHTRFNKGILNGTESFVKETVKVMEDWGCTQR